MTRRQFIVRWSGRAGLIAVLLVVSTLILPPNPAGAWDNDALEPTAGCRKNDDAFYVPRDTRGEWFWWFCRDENDTMGDGFGPLANSEGEHEVNQDQKASWSDWAPHNAAANGMVKFSQLRSEPCQTWETKKRITPNFDLDRRQCADVTKLLSRQSPCDQWWSLIHNLQGQQGVERVNTVKDGRRIATCRSVTAVFLRAWNPPKVVDTKSYSRNDFTAPGALAQELGGVIGLGQWVALSAAVIGVIACAAKLAVAYRSGFEEAGSGILVAMVGALLAISAVGISRMLLVE